jgi:DNA-binding transcriptional MerR regulator
MANQTEPHFRGPVACRMAGISYRQLDYWARTGLIRPSIEARGSGTQRRYTYREVVLLAMVRRMLDAGTSLGRARLVVDTLDGVEDLRGVFVALEGSRVYATRDGDEVINQVFNGGMVLAFSLDQIIAELDRLVGPNDDVRIVPEWVA